MFLTSVEHAVGTACTSIPAAVQVLLRCTLSNNLSAKLIPVLQVPCGGKLSDSVYTLCPRRREHLCFVHSFDKFGNLDMFFQFLARVIAII